MLAVLFAPDDEPAEPADDLNYIEGSAPRDSQQSGGVVASIADITSAEVRAEEGAVMVFATTMEAPLPQPLKKSALEVRWDIAGEEGPPFTLTVAVGKERHASIFSEAGYGAGTIDGTFPGELLIDGHDIEVRVDAAQIDVFPEGFEWRLATTLRAFRDEPDSPRVEDRYPDEGSNEFTR